MRTALRINLQPFASTGRTQRPGFLRNSIAKAFHVLGFAVAVFAEFAPPESGALPSLLILTVQETSTPSEF